MSLKKNEKDAEGVGASSPRKSTTSAKAPGPAGPKKAREAARTADSGGEPEAYADADAKVGAVVRFERQRRGWSLGVLAEQAMISVPMLSQIERGQATPSLRTLRLLAGALEVPITEFFRDDAQEEGANPYIVRADQRRRLTLKPTGIDKQFLMPPGASLLEMWEFVFAPGGTSGGALYNHQGEKAGVVIKGRIKLLIGDDVYELSEGDSFRFSSMLRHRVDNEADEEARVLWVLTPPASGGRAPSRQ